MASQIDECSLHSLHKRHEALVLQRARDRCQAPEGFEPMVDVLLEASKPRQLLLWMPSLASLNSRAALRKRQDEVRQALPGGLLAAVASRDAARACHADALRHMRDALLQATGSTSITDLDRAITDARAAAARVETALATARGAAAEEPCLGQRAVPPRNMASEIEASPEAAVQAYKDYVRALSSTGVTAATDAAMAAVHQELHSTALFLPGRGLRHGVAARVRSSARASSSAADVPCVVRVIAVCGEEVAVSFQDGSTETVQRDRVEEIENGDAMALEMLNKCVCKAHAAVGAEASFWHDLGPVDSFPCAQLLAAGRAELESRTMEVEMLHSVKQRHDAISIELEDEEEALHPEHTRDTAVCTFVEAAEANLDARDALHDALQAVQRARVRGKPVERLEEKASEVKGEAKRADADVRKAVLGLARAKRHFPEVAGDPRVLKHLRIGLPLELASLWCLGRTLDHFDTRESLPCPSKHRLYCVTEGDKSYVVKEYATVGGQDGLRVCLHEAALLTRARHPHIAEVVALFADPEEHGFFIQMPLYEQGSLDNWVAKRKPDDSSIRRVLSQVAAALAHLHGLGIVHADVKPGNILIDNRGFARLGDFDISSDSNSRTSTAWAQATMTQVGFTPGFAAPELLQTGASAATDIFALGATIAAVAPRTDERDSLLRRLQAPEPAARPSAEQVVQDAFFAPVFAWTREQRRACCICLEDGIRLEEGLECGRADGQPHFVCSRCLEQHVGAVASAELRLRQANEGRACCPGRPCDSAPYLDADLAKRVSARAFCRYTEARVALLEQRRAAELEGEMQARLGAELQRLGALDEQQRRVRDARHRIAEEVLTLKCPRCGQAFLDFAGCFALQCPRCACGFCAWCGADGGGSDAHEHVRTCGQKPPGADVFFGTFKQFEAAQRRRRLRLLRAFLPTLDAQTRDAVLQEMRRDLGDLGLAVEGILPSNGVDRAGRARA